MQVEVYPKAWLDGSIWYAQVRVSDSTGAYTEFDHQIAAGVSTVEPLRLLKVVSTLEIPDGTPLSDVDDSLFVDDAKPGGGVTTVWEEWQDIAEGKIGSRTDFTEQEFWEGWGANNTATIRQRASYAWGQRGWTVLDVHQHEGDGSVTE